MDNTTTTKQPSQPIVVRARRTRVPPRTKPYQPGTSAANAAPAKAVQPKTGYQLWIDAELTARRKRRARKQLKLAKSIATEVSKLATEPTPDPATKPTPDPDDVSFLMGMIGSDKDAAEVIDQFFIRLDDPEWPEVMDKIKKHADVLVATIKKLNKSNKTKRKE